MTFTPEPPKRPEEFPAGTPDEFVPDQGDVDFPGGLPDESPTESPPESPGE